MAKGQVKFRLDHVLVKLEAASEPMAEALALQLEARAKVKIQGNGQIDTGFMLNSVYTVSRRSATYKNTQADGTYTNQAGKPAKRKKAPQVNLPREALAACAVGASYAIFQEERQPFLYPASVETAKDSGVKASAEKVFRENIKD